MQIFAEVVDAQQSQVWEQLELLRRRHVSANVWFLDVFYVGAKLLDDFSKRWLRAFDRA